MAAVNMSDQQHNDLLGEVEHVNQLSDNIGALFMQDSYSDITLVVDGQRFVAHKVILAARSEYFRSVSNPFFCQLCHGFKRVGAGSCKFPTPEVVGAQNLNFAFEVAQNSDFHSDFVHFFEKNFWTRRKFSS